MKFSYTLIKKLVPGLKSKQQAIDALNMHAFEAADPSPLFKGKGGDVIDVSIYPNRFSDAASHIGLARELSAILNLELKLPKTKTQKPVKVSKKFEVTIKDKNLCPRYVGQYFENVKVGASPKWMQNVLKSCGLRPINNIVDITNYVMLELGEPMHAFDYDKLEKNSNGKTQIVIRRAKKGEKITTLDNEVYELDENVLVIADGFAKNSESVLAIAGIKGGKKAEITKNTRRIVVEAANFDGVNIYKTQKKIGLVTDAGVRFSHNISDELAILAMNRARDLLKEIAGAKVGELIDVRVKKDSKKIIRFEVEKFNKLIGIKSEVVEIINILKRLGFEVLLDKKSHLPSSFLVEVPPIRTDVEIFEDLAEEVARIIGYNNLKSLAPHIHLIPAGFEDEIILKDKIRNILRGFGFDEVYNYSFIGDSDLKQRTHPNDWKRLLLVELENPIAEDKKYLRPSLLPLLSKNIKDNFRFFDEVKIFEIGKVFYRDAKNRISSSNANILECLRLGIAIGNKISKIKKETFYELKGVVEELFRKIGLADFNFREAKNSVEIYSQNQAIGVLKNDEENSAFAEIDLEKLLEIVEEEFEYEPLSKYPTVIRDVSILVDRLIRIGEIMQEIQLSDPVLIQDVDLIDEYESENFEENKKSLTFRIIFQHKNRTLTDKEVDERMAKIHSILIKKFKAQIR